MKLFLLLLVSVALRLFLLGSKSLWIDECLAWGATRMGWLEMVRSVASGTPHPPLAFVVMKLSTMIAGNGEFGLRFLVALFTASAVVPVYRLASRRTSQSGGFFAALLWAVSPFAVSLGQEAWVYGINASLSLWFAFTADEAWRGSKTAFACVFPLGFAGILTQHVFVLSVACGCVLYLSVPDDQRISFRKFVSVPAVLAVLYIPLMLCFLPQFAARSQRMAQAGMHTDASRLFSTDFPSQFFRILFGGILPDITANLFERPRMLAAYAVNSFVVLFLGVFPFFMGRKWNLPGLKWLWIAFLLPFGLFLNDAPGVRQLAVLWVPFSVTSAAVFSRVRFSGGLVCLFCAAGLVPYYMLDVFPYHHSNWRDAVQKVESEAAPGDTVVVFGGKSTALAWDFYSGTSMEALTPGGCDPFSGESGRNRMEPEEFIRELAEKGSSRRIWIILDIWGIPSIESFTDDYSLVFHSYEGRDMEIGLIEISPRPQ